MAADRSIGLAGESVSSKSSLTADPFAARRAVTPQLVPLAEEVGPPSSSAPVADSLGIPSTALPRHEVVGPQPILLAEATTHTLRRTETGTQRVTNLAASDTIATPMATPVPPRFARRESVVPPASQIAAVDPMGGMGASAPGILLTSASMLVELLASAPMPPLTRAESSSTVTAPASPASVGTASWSARVWNGFALIASPPPTEPAPLGPKTSLPRRVRESTPAALVETIPIP
jgi:hypothetical protein